MKQIVHKQFDTYQIFIVKRIDDEAFLRSYLVLDEADQERLLKIPAIKRRTEWLTSRYLLKKLMNADTKIHYTEHGKPRIDSGNISISHSNTFVGIIFSEQKQVAIDIELASERVERLADKFISADEQFFLERDTFYKTLIWSAKEALYKMDHHDLFDFKKNYTILPFEINKDGGNFMGIVKSDTFEKEYTLHYSFMENNAVVWIAR